MPGRDEQLDPDDPPRLLGIQLSSENLARLQFLSAAIRRRSGVALGASAIVRALVGWLAETDIDTGRVRSAEDLREQLSARTAALATPPRPRGGKSDPVRPSAFGLRLKALRQARRLSIRRTAALAAISDAYLSRLERGIVSPPSPSTIARLEAVLHAEPDELTELAARIPADVKAILLLRPREMGQLIRSVGSLSDEEVGRLVRELKSPNPRKGS